MYRSYCIFSVKVLFSSLFLSLFVSLSASANDEVKQYSFGVVPQQSAKVLAKLWAPVLNYVGDKAGVKLQFKTAKNIPEFEKRLAAGDYDLAYMNPYHFTVFNASPGYKAMAVRKNQGIKGIMVVRKDSDISELSQLADSTLAFPAPAAFAASVLSRAELAGKDIPFTPKYVSSHDSVYLAVSKGLFPAGGGVMRTFNNTSPDVKDQLQVLWTSKAFTPHAVAAHPDVKQEDFLRIQQAFVAMVNDPDGRSLLKTLKIKHGLIVANDSDWDDVRGLGLELLDRLINQQ